MVQSALRRPHEFKSLEARSIFIARSERSQVFKIRVYGIVNAAHEVKMMVR